MPTNEERREVAKELRYTASHSLNGYGFQRAVEGIVFGTLGDRTWRKILERLADLIEPEEHTCRIKQHRCTNCDHEINERAYFAKVVLDDGCWTAESRTANFCPNCGAKVASDD